jgi:hypothetical protein
VYIFSKSTQTFLLFYIKSITFYHFQINKSLQNKKFQINKSLQNKKFHFSIQIFLLFSLISIKSFYYSPGNSLAKHVAAVFGTLDGGWWLSLGGARRCSLNHDVMWLVGFGGTRPVGFGSTFPRFKQQEGIGSYLLPKTNK